MKAAASEVLEITIHQGDPAGWPVVVTQVGADGLRLQHQETLHVDRAKLAELDQQGGEKHSALSYGTFLGEALFQGRVRDAFMQAHGRASGAAKLRVVLDVSDSDLQTLRWDRLCAPLGARGKGRHLFLDQRVLYSLTLPTDTTHSYEPIETSDLNALIVLADPPANNHLGLPPFDARAMATSLDQALGEQVPHSFLGPVEGALGPATLDALCASITARRYTVLHIVAHGAYLPGKKDGPSVIFLADVGEDMQREARSLVDAEQFIEKLESIDGLPHLVFLASCESARPEAEEVLGGFAQQLVRDLGIPAVVAMTARVHPETARALAAAFYAQLLKHGEVDRALAEARAGLQSRYDIGVPVLFSRLHGQPLFSDKLDERPLTSGEIRYGLVTLAAHIPDRAPVLEDTFVKTAQAVCGVLGNNDRDLSPVRRSERDEAQKALDALSQEVFDLSFDAVALHKPIPAYDSNCPFPGLKAFERKEKRYFCQRETKTKELVARLEQERFLAILGASGSGKSSIVFAGMVPMLEELSGKHGDTFKDEDLRPGSRPILSLEPKLRPLPGIERRLLIVDQFEELFTLCRDVSERRRFLDSLLAAWLADPTLNIVITMRSEFLGACAFHEEFRQKIEEHVALLPAMSPEELRRAMVDQANAVGLRFEAELSHQIWSDVEGEPGAMPLSQHLLRELWKRRHGRHLKQKEYQALGRVEKAISHTAEAVYGELGKEDPLDQERMRYIFVRLTHLGDEVEGEELPRDTRQRVSLKELTPHGGDRDKTEKVVNRLDDARLVLRNPDEKTGETEVEVAHEALIRHWRRLREWIAQDRDQIQLRDTIRKAERDWAKAQKKDSYLIHKGGRLEDAETLAKELGFLDRRESDYVEACIQLRDDEQREREKRAQELAAALKFAEEESRRGKASELSALRQLAATYRTSGFNERDRENGNLLKAAHYLALAAELHAQTQDLPSVRSARFALRFLTGCVRLRAAVGHSQNIFGATLNADATRILTWSDDGTARVWDSSTGEALTPPLVHKQRVRGAQFSTDENRVLTWSEDGTARMWDSTTGEALTTPLAHKHVVWGARFNADETRILTWSDDGTAQVWDSKTGEAQIPPLAHKDRVIGALFNVDETRILTWSVDGTARVWDGKSGEALTQPLVHEERIQSGKFNANGTRVLTTSDDGTARLWDSRTGDALTPPLKHENAVWSAQFNSNETRILTWSEDGTARVWDSKTGDALTPPLGQKTGVEGAAFNSDETRVLTWGVTGVRVWDSETGEALTPLLKESGARGAAFNSDETRILTWGYDKARVWDSGTGEALTPLLGHGSSVENAWFNSDETSVITCCMDGSIHVWDVGTGGELLLPLTLPLTTNNWSQSKVEIHASKSRFQMLVWSRWCRQARACDINIEMDWRQTPPLVHEEAIRGARFSADETRILTWSEDCTAQVWDSRAGMGLIPPLKHEMGVKGAKFSADETRILTWDGCGGAQVWDSTTGQALTPPLGSCVDGACFNADQTRVLTWGDNGARVWDSTKGEPVTPELGEKGLVKGALFNADETRILTWGVFEARVWNATTGEPMTPPLGERGQVEGARFNADETQILTWGERDTARVWDSRTGQAVTPPLVPLHERPLQSARFNTDGSRILTLDGYGRAQVWDSKTGDALTPPLSGTEAGVGKGARFNTDETRILTWGGAGVHVWNSGTGEALIPPLKHNDCTQGAVFNADETRILTWSRDNTARVWDSATGEPVTPPLAHKKSVQGARFSADETQILTWSRDGTARLWNSTTGEALTPPLEHRKGSIENAIFNADETRILTWSTDGTVRLWNVPADEAWPDDQLILKLQVETGTEITSLGEVRVLEPAEWRRKRWCEYDKISHQLGRITDEEWEQSRLRCEQLKRLHTTSGPETPEKE